MRAHSRNKGATDKAADHRAGVPADGPNDPREAAEPAIGERAVQSSQTVHIRNTKYLISVSTISIVERKNSGSGSEMIRVGLLRISDPDQPDRMKETGLHHGISLEVMNDVWSDEQ